MSTTTLDKPRRPKHVTVSFDRVKKVLRVEPTQPVITPAPVVTVPVEASAIRLRDVTFVVRPGYRDGCVQTGSLGFVRGEAVRFNAEHNGYAPVKFNGQGFVNAEGVLIEKALEAVIVDGKVHVRL